MAVMETKKTLQMTVVVMAIIIIVTTGWLVQQGPVTMITREQPQARLIYLARGQHLLSDKGYYHI